MSYSEPSTMPCTQWMLNKAFWLNKWRVNFSPAEQDYGALRHYKWVLKMLWTRLPTCQRLANKSAVMHIELTHHRDQRNWVPSMTIGWELDESTVPCKISIFSQHNWLCSPNSSAATTIWQPPASCTTLLPQLQKQGQTLWQQCQHFRDKNKGFMFDLQWLP